MATEWTCHVCTLVNSISISKCDVCENPRRANPERARRSSILSFHQEVNSPPARKKSSPARSASSQCSPTSQSSAGASLVITLDDDSPKPAKLKASTPKPSSTSKKKPQGRKRLRKSTSSDEGSDEEESELELTQEEDRWAAKQKGGKGKGKGKGGGKSPPPQKAKARKPPARKARKPKDSDSSSSGSDSGSGSSTESDDAMDVGVKASAKAPIRRASRGKASGGGGVEVIELEEDEDHEEKEQGEDKEDREEDSKPSGGSKPSRSSRVKRVREEDDGSDTDGSDLLAIDVTGQARGQRDVGKGSSSSGTRALAPMAPVQVVSSPVRRPSTAPASTASPMVLDLSEGPEDTGQAHEATGGEDEGAVVEVEVGPVVRRQTADDPWAALLEADANGWDGQTHLHVKRPRTSTHSGASASGLHAWHPLYRTTDALPPEVLAARRPSPSTARHERDREEGSPSSSVASASPHQAPPPPVSAVPSFKMTLGNDDDEDESDEDEEPVRAQPDKGQAQGTTEESKTVKKEPLSSPPLSTQEAAATLKTLGQELDLPPQQPIEPSSHSNGLLNVNGPPEWACSHCTYKNISDVDMCQMCECARENGKAEGEGGWKHEGPAFETEHSSLWHHDMEDPGGMEHDDDDMGLCPEGSFSDDNIGDEEEEDNEEDLLDEYGDGEEEWEEQGDSKPRAKKKTEVCDLTAESSGDDDTQDSDDDVQDFDDEPSVVRRGGEVPPDHDFLPHFRSISRAMAHGGLTVNFDEMLRMDDVSVAGYDKRRKSREARDNKKKGRRKKGGGKKRAGGGNKFWQRKRAKT